MLIGYKNLKKSHYKACQSFTNEIHLKGQLSSIDDMCMRKWQLFNHQHNYYLTCFIFGRYLLKDCMIQQRVCVSKAIKNNCKRPSSFHCLLGEKEVLCQALAVPQNGWQFHPLFVLTFSNTWKNKRGPLITGNPSRLQQGFNGLALFWVWGKRSKA